MRKEQEIFTQVNAQNVPVTADILDILEQEVVNESVLRKYIREMLTEKKLRGQKDKRTLYHINKRPATPQPKVTYWEQWDPQATDRDTGEKTGDFVKVPDTNIWKRHWLDSPVKSGVFLTPNPLDIAMNHGRTGHVYAYKVPEWVIDKSGGMHRYDTGSEVLIPEDVWNEAGKEIEFMGKSMGKEELWDKMMPTSYGRGHHRPGTKPSWMSDEEMEKWQTGQAKFNLPGLRATKYPEDVIKLLTPEERRKAIEAIEAKNQNDPTRIEKGPRDKKGIVVPGTAPGIDKKNQELLALLNKHMKESMVREYIREMLIEKIEGWDYMSPPRDFKDKTGVDMIHDYNLPPEYPSPEALQDYVNNNEPEDPQDATRFYAPIVDDLVELNPELAPIAGLGKPEESMLLPDQQLTDVYPHHLRDIALGVASEMPVADIRYYLEDSSTSKEVDDIIQQFTDQTGVRPEWIISPETAAKHIELRERRLREYIREQLLLERQSLMSSVTDYIGTHDYDDMMDDVFKQLAPNLVRHVLTREVNEDMAEFLDGAREGRFERRADWTAKDPSPQEIGYDAEAADYVLGYTWGWDNAKTWDGEQLPDQARKEAVERQIEEFEDQISEQMIIAALEAANEKVNPIKLLGKAKDAIWNAVEEEGIAGGLKKGIPIAVGMLVGEALDNFIIPMAFYSMTGIPIPPLPVGVGEIINPVVISMVGADVESEELADELGWYEDEYGEAPSLGPRQTNELRQYIRELLTEAAKGLSEFEERGMYIAIEDLGDQFEIKLYDFDPAHSEPGTPDVASPAGVESNFPDDALGLISAMKESSPDNGPCLDGFTITWVSVSESGWGPLLYDLAMELATSKGSGLTPDRQSVSFEANKVWDYYLANRSDVEMVQMDDLSNRLTPGTKEDNCAMTLAYERGLESGTFWDEDNEETPWDPYGKDVLEQSPLTKMGVWKGAANIDAIKAMDRWIEI